MVKPKHILFIVENNPLPGDYRVWNEVRLAREAGYAVSAICPAACGWKEGWDLIEGVRIFRHPQPAEGNGKLSMLAEYVNAVFWEVLSSLRIFILHRFDVIHAANPPDHIVLIALFFKLFGVKFIFDHHDLTPETFVAKFGRKSVLHRVLLWMEKLSIRTADVVISTNTSYKSIAMQRDGKEEKDIFVVRNGPVLGSAAGVQPDPRLREGFRYLVGYVGKIGRQEGIENLLQIADYLVKSKNRKDIGFIVIGAGPHLKAVKKLSQEMGINGTVRFTGYIPRQELDEILRTVDVCVNPEFRNDFTDKSTMIKIMEYMHSGTPIIQFRTTEGTRSAGEAAIYIEDNSIRDFAEALVKLLEDPQKRAEMSRIGLERIEKELCWDVQKKNLVRAYQHLFSRP
jgi:glycosyltransferase involved in cell wall biosynthesis